MGFAELFLIAVGLSMDAFAVSICKGLSMKVFIKRDAITVALFFGVFQAVMPLIGWALGIQFQSYISSFDHWIAFGLLAFLGVKMIIDARNEGESESCREYKFSLSELFVLAIATSIDALAVGITFALLDVSIVYAVTFIGITTFALSLVGVCIGKAVGGRFANPAQIAGGVILIAIGVKILLEHLGVINI